MGERAGPNRRRWATVVLVVVVVLAGTPPVVGGTSHDGATAFAQMGEVDPDAVLLSVEVRPDGTAVWRVEYRVRLDDDNTTAAFEQLQADVDANESAYTARFGDRMAATVESAETATGREMTLRNLSVDTSVEQLPQTYGVLVYTFEWTAFAVVEDEQLRVGDALAGLFLDADSTLLISWPASYTVVDVSPTPTEQRDRSVHWRGPLDFGPDEPDLVLAAGGADRDVDPSLVGLAVVGLALLGGGAVWWWRRGQTGARASGTSDEASRPPDELLSNEERVVALLEAHDGRMKQQDVVEALGWTDAKTSQVVSKLRESGRIEGFRLGRENVLRLPSADDPTGTADRSPDDARDG